MPKKEGVQGSLKLLKRFHQKEGVQGSLEYIIIIGGVIIIAAATYFMLKGFAQTTGAGTTEAMGVAGDKFRLELENLGRAETKFFANKWGSFPQVSILTLSNTGTATTAEITLNNLTDYGLVLDEIEFAYNYSGAIETLDYTIEQPSNPDSPVTFTSPTLPEGSPTVPSYTGILIFHNNSSADELDNLNYTSSDPDVNVTEDGGTSPVQSPDVTPPAIVISSTAFGSAGSVKDADIQVTVTDANSSITEVYYSIDNSPYFNADNLYYTYQDIVLEGHPEDYSYGSNSETIHIIATVPDENNYTVRVRAVDEYSNERVETQNVSIVIGVPTDATPPVILSTQPANNTLVNDSILAVNLTTNEDAECRYGIVGGLMFSAMSSMDLSGSTFHQHNFTLVDGENYTYYFKCNDTFGNLNYTDYVLNFTKSMPPVDYPPAILSTQPANNTLVNDSILALNLTTNENAECRFNDSSGTMYEFMTPMDYTGTAMHQHNFTLVDGENYTYYFKCNDSAGNVNYTDYMLNFSKSIPQLYSPWPMLRFSPARTGAAPFGSQVNQDKNYFNNYWPAYIGSSQTGPAVAELDLNFSNGLEVVAGYTFTDAWVGAWHANGSPVDGWPKQTPESGQTYSSPAVADLDGNLSNGLEVVAGNDAGYVHAWHANGTEVAGWPTMMGPGWNSSPAVADLDGNPANGLEVVMGWGYGVLAWHADGTDVSGWPISLACGYGSSVAVLDFDGNPSNGLEVITLECGEVLAWHADGSVVSGWDIFQHPIDSLEGSSVAVADMDGNPGNGPEVLICSDAGTAYAWHADGSDVTGWSGISCIYSTPAIADIDGNAGNGLEAILGNWVEVYAMHPDGTVVSGWPKSTPEGIYSSPAVADLDGNLSNGLEIVIGSDNGSIYAWHADGSNVAGWPQAVGGGVYTSPAVVELDGNFSNGLEVIVGSEDDHLYVWNSDGTQFSNP